jgi:hypothetical protein
MRVTKVTAALVGILALATAMPRALAGGAQMPQDMPAQELLQYAPEGTQGVIAIDATRLPQQQLSSATTSGPIKPTDLQTVVAFIGWNQQMMGTIMGGQQGSVPATAIVTHGADRGTVQQFLSQMGSSAGTTQGVDLYRVQQQDGRDAFVAIADDGALIAGSSRDSVASLVESYTGGQGAGLPDTVASMLRPGDGAAIVAAFAIPQQLAAMADQNPAIPAPLKALNGLSVSLSFPGEELDLQAVGLFRGSQQASMVSQMVSRQIENLKQQGAGMMMPGGQGGTGPGQGGANPLADLLDTVQVSSSGSELTVSMRASTAMLQNTVSSGMSSAMGLPGGMGPGASGGGPQGLGAQGGPATDDSTGSTQQGGQAQQQQTSAEGASIATADKQKNGVTVQVTVRRGSWFREDRLLVETKVTNRSGRKRLISYGYRLTDSGGSTVGESGGAAELDAGDSTTFTGPAIDRGKEGQVSGVNVTYIDLLSGANDEN